MFVKRTYDGIWKPGSEEAGGQLLPFSLPEMKPIHLGQVQIWIKLRPYS